MTDKHEEEFSKYDLPEYGYANAEEAFIDLSAAGFYGNADTLPVGAETVEEFHLWQRSLDHMPAGEGDNLRDLVEDNVALARLVGWDAHEEFLEGLEAARRAADFGAAQQLRYQAEREEYEPPEREQAGTGYRTGAAFEGPGGIDEYEDADYYVPTSSYCLLRCFEKFFELTGPPLELSRKGVKCNMTLKRLRIVLDAAGVDPTDVPRLFKPVFDKDKQSWGFDRLVVKKDPARRTDYAIVLMPIDMGTGIEDVDGNFLTTRMYHACLIKNPPHNAKGEIACKRIDFYRLAKHLRKGKRTVMTAAGYAVVKNPPSAPLDTVYAYDYETSTVDGFKQRPEGVSIMRVPLVGPASRITADTVTKDFIGDGCTDKMLDWAIEDAKAQDLKEIQMFAHNGGKFDTLIALGDARGIKWEKQLTAGGSIKELRGKCQGLVVCLKDSCPFVLQSLKDAGKNLGCEVQKSECDIANHSHEWFEENRDWIPYMGNDVRALGCILVTMEKNFRALTQSLTRSCGVSAMAWNLIMHNAAPEFGKVEVPRCPVMQAFHSEASYGGRILHWRKNFKAGITKIECPRLGSYLSRGLICYDANSLYPYCMAEFDYPYGTPQLVQGGDAIYRLAAWKKAREEGKLYIAEVTFDAGNQRYPLIPHRLPNGNVQYAAGVFSGVYTSVDIDEATAQGYRVLAVQRATVWPKRANMFRKIIEKLFKQRAELKAKKDTLEYVIKIILNSMYGKFRETVDTAITFALKPEIKSSRKLMSSVELPNGQIRRKFKLLDAMSRKPTHIAAFILSYSKLHMNRLIMKLGPENVFYGDTDSVYATVESGADITEGEQLGGFKNDYGPGVFLTEAIFLDLKRYFIRYNSPQPNKKNPKEPITHVCKFNGLNFKHQGVLSDFIEGAGLPEDRTRLDEARAFYEQLQSHPEQPIRCLLDRWTRKGVTVYIAPDQHGQFTVSPAARAQWHDEEFYPIGFDRQKATLPFIRVRAKEPDITPSQPYLMMGKKIHMNHPVTLPTEFLTLSVPEEDKRQAASSMIGFAKSGKDLVMRIGGYWHQYTTFGPGKRVSSEGPPEGAKPLLAAPSPCAPMGSMLTEDEVSQFHRLVDKMMKAHETGLVAKYGTTPPGFTLDDVYQQWDGPIRQPAARPLTDAEFDELFT